MKMISRIGLLILTNLAVVIVIGILMRVLGLDVALVGKGLQPMALLAYSMIAGFSGAFISLLLSKFMAKWTTGAKVIESPRDETEAWLFATVERLARGAQISRPEIAIYDSEDMNAFATGAFRNSALVAVSTGLLRGISREAVEGVLAHEIAHVANGDMITMTLVQGVLNTFVIFLSRVVGYAVDKLVLRNDDRRGPGIGYTITVILSQIVLGILASLIASWYSRRREFRADAGSAQLLGRKQPMINALARLGGLDPGEMPKAMQAMGISSRPSGLMALFSTHPPMEERIARLRQIP